MRIRGRAVWLLGGVAAVLIVAHAIPLYFLYSRKILSVTVIAGILILVLIRHLSFFSPLTSLLRRRSGSTKMRS